MHPLEEKDQKISFRRGLPSRCCQRAAREELDDDDDDDDDSEQEKNSEDDDKRSIVLNLHTTNSSVWIKKGR